MSSLDSKKTFEPTDLLTDDELAAFLDVTPQYIRTGRMKKPKWTPPPHIEISPRLRRTLFADVLRWIEERRIDPSNRAA